MPQADPRFSSTGSSNLAAEQRAALAKDFYRRMWRQGHVFLLGRPGQACAAANSPAGFGEILLKAPRAHLKFSDISQ